MENSTELNLVILQKQRNGKEIWEGDILENKTDEFLCNTGRFVVSYKDGYFNYFMAYKTGEVLGNLYENPELLK